MNRDYIVYDCTDNAVDPETEGDPPKVPVTEAPKEEGEDPEDEDDDDDLDDSDDDDDLEDDGHEISDEPKGGE
jgi:hypothetical protein